MSQKTKNMVGWILTALLAGLFLMSAFSKLSGGEDAVNGFRAMGLSDNERIGIGIVELLSIILFIIPRTGVLGTMLLIGYMGGTIMAHLSINQPYALNIAIGLLIGITALIRFPELGARLFGKIK